MTTTGAIYADLAGVFEEVFPEAGVELSAQLESSEVEGWDSLGHVGLIVAVEDRFGIEFRPEEYEQFASVGALVTLIEAKLV